MSPIERFATNLSTFVVGLSGGVYAVMKYLMISDDPFSVVNHPWQPWVLDLHVLAGPAMIFAIGWIARDHILSKTRNRNGSGAGRGTGLLAVVCLLPMISTGYLIQVFTNETARAACVWIHLATGTVYFVLFVAHLVVSRRLAARRRAIGQIGTGRAQATGLFRSRRPAVRGGL